MIADVLITGERIRLTFELFDTVDGEVVPYTIPHDATTKLLIRQGDVTVAGPVTCDENDPAADWPNGIGVAVFPKAVTSLWTKRSNCSVEVSVAGSDGEPDKWLSPPIFHIARGLIT